MTSPADRLQRISVLTPLAEILSRVDALASPVAASELAAEAALGKTLGADIVAQADLPQRASAMLDGWAVASERTDGASAYAPVVLPHAPVWVDVSETMPEGTDAILHIDAVSITGRSAELVAPATQGEGVAPAGFNITKGMALRRAGERLRQVDVAIFRALKIDAVSVRAPRVKIVCVSLHNANIEFVAPVIANAVRAMGGTSEIIRNITLETAVSTKDFDAIITIGGTGSGKNDTAVKSLARAGKVEFHGFGISPGQTAALGSVNGCPVLMLPGSLDAALAVFLVAGKHLMDRLTGAGKNEIKPLVLLAKKITSTIGLSEVVYVRCVAGGVEPLGNGVFPLQALLRADGWVLVPPGSEGLAAGTTVEMRSLP